MSRLIARLRDHAIRSPARTAVILDRGMDGAALTTYGELADLAGAFSKAFEALGEDAAFIPVLASKSPDSVAAVLAALACGKAFVSINRKLRLPQVVSILQTTGARVMLIDGAGLMALHRELPDSPLVQQVEFWVLREAGWSAMHDRIVRALREKLTVRLWPDEFDSAGAAMPDPPADEQTPGCCLFTSGSTGQPKGVLIAAADLDARAEAEVECFGLSADDVLLNILPWSFDVGLNQMLSSIWVGAALVLTDSWLPADILRMVAQHRVTGISSVPAIWRDVINAGMRFHTTGQHRSLRYVTVSGGDLSRGHLAKLPAMAPGVGIFKTYGQTEAFRATALLPEYFQSRITSCGRPFGSAHVYVVKPDGTPAGPDEPGEVVHSGLGVMLGYLNGQDVTNKLRPNPFHGPDDPAPLAIFTGDEGHFDAEGFLYIHGRRDTMLKVMGNRVYPNEASAALAAVEGVQEAEVIGVKDEDGQATLVGFIVYEQANDRTPMLIQRELSTRLPTYMIPQRIVVLPAMPRTGSGKTDSPALLAQAKALLG